MSPAEQFFQIVCGSFIYAKPGPFCKPGEIYQKMPENVKEFCRSITSEDINKLRPDLCSGIGCWDKESSNTKVFKIKNNDISKNLPS